MHDLWIPGPVDRPHPRKQVGGLLRCVVEKLRDDLDAADRPHDRDQRHQVERRAHDALGHREAVPLARAGRGRRRHWNSLRMKPETSSPTITTAMIASTIVSTKS